MCQIITSKCYRHFLTSNDITMAPFQRVLPAAARTVLDLKPRDRVTPAVRD